jgi:hypothetical protein
MIHALFSLDAQDTVRAYKVKMAFISIRLIFMGGYLSRHCRCVERRRDQSGGNGRAGAGWRVCCVRFGGGVFLLRRRFEHGRSVRVACRFFSRWYKHAVRRTTSPVAVIVRGGAGRQSQIANLGGCSCARAACHSSVCIPDLFLVALEEAGLLGGVLCME